jgi:hypothetical protein
MIFPLVQVFTLMDEPEHSDERECIGCFEKEQELIKERLRMGNARYKVRFLVSPTNKGRGMKFKEMKMALLVFAFIALTTSWTVNCLIYH